MALLLENTAAKMFYNFDNSVYDRKWRFTAVSYGRRNSYNIDHCAEDNKLLKTHQARDY